MRDILFKAKRISDGQWVEGYYVEQYGSTQIYLLDDNSREYEFDCVHVDKTTLCQYTGLTDKKGNKIWENDIVLVDKIDKAVVIFSEKHSGYILQPIGDFYFDSPMLIHNINIIDNIIGNTFDNAELLEGGVK